MGDEANSEIVGDNVEEGILKNQCETDSTTSTTEAASFVTSGSIASKDDSWEVKYAKLREVALRYKKSAADKTNEILELKSENSKLSRKSQTVSTIQQECDKALDEVEKYRSLNRTLQKDLEASVRENVHLKQRTCEFQEQIHNLNESTESMKERIICLSGSENEAITLRCRLGELEVELGKLKELQATDAQEEKRQRILSLEISDFEAKLLDANAKILEFQKCREVGDQELDEKTKIICSLDTKVKETDELNDELRNEKAYLKSELEQKLEKITFLQNEISKLNEKLSEKTSEHVKLSREFENAKLNFSFECNALVERCDKLGQTISKLENNISVLEENKRSRESHVSNLKLELVQLETEFSNYKLKALTMLNTQKPHSELTVGNRSADELENLQKVVLDFHSEIAVLKSDVKTLKLENETLNLERVELGLKLTQLKTLTAEKEYDFEAELQKYKESIRQKELQHQSNLETFRIEKGALIASQAVQLESQKSNYEQNLRTNEDEIKNLAAQIELLQELNRNQTFRDEEYLAQHKEAIVPPSVPLAVDTSYDQFRMMPRGECEGSENNTSPQNNLLITRSNSHELTFEELLNSDIQNLSNDVPSTTSQFRSSAMSLQSLRDEVGRSRNNIRHLQSILRESESNCERLTKLNDVLKQEIRRIERDGERKEHLKENTEYLKNVVLKFVTLHGEDEKLQLIPVLRTILQLSPIEVEEIEAAIKGSTIHSSNDVGRDDGDVSRGWTSYVPRWSFGGK